MTLSDLEWPWTAKTHSVAEKMRLLEPTAQMCMKIDPYYQRQKCRPMNVVSENIRFMEIFAGVPLGGGVKWLGLSTAANFGGLCGFLVLYVMTPVAYKSNHIISRCTRSRFIVYPMLPVSHFSISASKHRLVDPSLRQHADSRYIWYIWRLWIYRLRSIVVRCLFELPVTVRSVGNDRQRLPTASGKRQLGYKYLSIGTGSNKYDLVTWTRLNVKLITCSDAFGVECNLNEIKGLKCPIGIQFYNF